jgi:hypothetical protein
MNSREPHTLALQHGGGHVKRENRKGGADRGAALEKRARAVVRDQNLWIRPVRPANRGSLMTATALRGLVTVEVIFTGLISGERVPRMREEAT